MDGKIFKLFNEQVRNLSGALLKLPDVNEAMILLDFAYMHQVQRQIFRDFFLVGATSNYLQMMYIG